MKTTKVILSLIMVLCLSFCMTACGETDEFDGFDPVGVLIIEKLNGQQIDTNIEDKKTTQKLWDMFKELDINDEEDGKMGSAYVYMRFYDEDVNNIAVFTIYDNGSCCLGEEFDVFYSVTEGTKAYLDFYDVYTEYANSNAEDNSST